MTLDVAFESESNMAREGALVDIKYTKALQVIKKKNSVFVPNIFFNDTRIQG